MTTSPDFEGLLAAPVAGDVPHVVAGGYSAMLHGSSLMTRDPDIVCSMDSACILELHAALQSLHPVHRMGPNRPPFTRQQASGQEFQNLYRGTDLGVLDCLAEIRGIGNYDACFRRITEISLGRVTTQILNLTAMIDAKKAMGRPKDLLTADELEIIRDRRSR